MSNSNDITVLNGKLRLLQAPDGFRTSIDAVLLAAACPAQNGHSILDLGCGVGSAGLCALHRLPQTTLHGIDIQASHTLLAQENAAINSMESRATFAKVDIRNFDGGAFDHIICNPPYEEAGAHTPSPSTPRATALGHLASDITLKDWVECAWRNIKGRGSLTIIHKAEALDDIILALGKSFGATEIIPLYPKAGKAAGRVLIRSYKHRKTPCTLHSGIILHNDNGDYTDAAEAILRGGEAL